MHKKSFRKKQYNCRRCRAQGDFEKRKCFWYGGEVQIVQARQPAYDKETDTRVLDTKTHHSVDVEQFFELLMNVTDVFQEMSMLEALRIFFPEVCPKSLVNNEIDMLLAMESFCREYHLPPLPADQGYLDYPSWLVDVFGAIGMARERINMKEIKEMRARSGE